MKTYATIHNIDTKEQTTICGQTNDIKAFMFDMIMNSDYDLAYIHIDEIIQDEEYLIKYSFNETTAHSFIDIDYTK